MTVPDSLKPGWVIFSHGTSRHVRDGLTYSVIWGEVDKHRGRLSILQVLVILYYGMTALQEGTPPGYTNCSVDTFCARRGFSVTIIFNGWGCREPAAVLVKSSFQFRDAGFRLGYSYFLLFNECDDCIRVGMADDTAFFTLQCHFTTICYIPRLYERSNCL